MKCNHLARLDQNSSETSADYPARVVIEQGRRIECVNSAIARNVTNICIMTEIASRIAPCSDGVALAIETSLRAERSILMELLSAVVGTKLQLKVVVSDVAPSGVLGLERETGAVPETSANCPACLLLESSAAR